MHINCDFSKLKTLHMLLLYVISKLNKDLEQKNIVCCL